MAIWDQHKARRSKMVLRIPLRRPRTPCPRRRTRRTFPYRPWNHSRTWRCPPAYSNGRSPGDQHHRLWFPLARSRSCPRRRAALVAWDRWDTWDSASSSSASPPPLAPRGQCPGPARPARRNPGARGGPSIGRWPGRSGWDPSQPPDMMCAAWDDWNHNMIPSPRHLETAGGQAHHPVALTTAASSRCGR